MSDKNTTKISKSIKNPLHALKRYLPYRNSKPKTDKNLSSQSRHSHNWHPNPDIHITTSQSRHSHNWHPIPDNHITTQTRHSHNKPITYIIILPPNSHFQILPPNSHFQIYPPNSHFQIYPPNSHFQIYPPNTNIPILQPITDYDFYHPIPSIKSHLTQIVE